MYSSSGGLSGIYECDGGYVPFTGTELIPVLSDPLKIYVGLSTDGQELTHRFGHRACTPHLMLISGNQINTAIMLTDILRQITERSSENSMEIVLIDAHATLDGMLTCYADDYVGPERADEVHTYIGLIRAETETRWKYLALNHRDEALAESFVLPFKKQLIVLVDAHQLEPSFEDLKYLARTARGVGVFLLPTSTSLNRIEPLSLYMHSDIVMLRDVGGGRGRYRRRVPAGTVRPAITHISATPSLVWT